MMRWMTCCCLIGDLSILARITHSDLLDHIRRVGVALYEKTPVEAKR